MRTIEPFVIPSTPSRPRSDATLASESEANAIRARDAIVKVIATARTHGAQVQTLREALATAGAGGSRLKVVIPPDMATALERGDWRWIESKDGLGFLPTVTNADGTFTRQVRISRETFNQDPTALANAAAHAQTHAMLRQILEKLEVMDAKLDLGLAYQRDGWTGLVVAGIKQFKAVSTEPGESTGRAAVHANALQSLEEGRNIGLRQLDSFIAASCQKPVPRWNGWLEMGSPAGSRAKNLDRVQEDITWLYGAARTIAAIHSASGRPLAARRTLGELATVIAPHEPTLSATYEYAQYSKPREDFWKIQFPALLESRSLGASAIGLDIDAGEFMLTEGGNQHG